MSPPFVIRYGDARLYVSAVRGPEGAELGEGETVAGSARNVAITAGLVLAGCGPQPTQSGAEKDFKPTPSSEIVQRTDARRLLGASKPRVSELLGRPSACRREGRGESCAYGPATGLPDQTEIFFVGSRAARLTLPGYGLAYRPESLRAFGLSAGEPVLRNEHVIRWHTSFGSIPVEIDMFPAGDAIFYLYVIARDIEI